jgi:hypothetical protein
MFHAIHTVRQATVALTLAVSLVALTASQALAGGGSSTYHDGWYGYAVAQTKASQHSPLIDGRSPDTVDAALAARQRDFGPPDGWYGYAVSITKQAKLDGRSPVQRIIAQENARAAAALAGGGAKYGPPDGWYSYAVALTKADRRPPTVDGRSPDTIDAAVQAHAPVVTIVRSPGFEWGDFGIGVAAAFGAMLLGLSIRILAARQSRKQPSSVATA